MSLFNDAVNRTLPVLKKDWAASTTDPPVEKSPTTEPPATHHSEAAMMKTERGLQDPQLMLKMQELALPVGSTNQVTGAGNIQPMAGALAPPNTGWGTK
jgi:hypothetical protein